jgi:predicted RNase H-like nuclease
MRVAGVDVWKARWVAIVLEDGRYEDVLVASGLGPMLDALTTTTAIGVDMPLGLPVGREPRLADAAARRFIGPRRGSSVFPVYPCEVYLADGHAAAAVKSLSVMGKSISQHAYAIGKRLLEADAVTAGRPEVFEVHPEVSFCAMAGAPLTWSKTSWNGMHERVSLLCDQGSVLPVPIPIAGDAGSADLLDAAAGAWSAARIASNQASSLPDPPQVVDGRQVAIWY